MTLENLTNPENNIEEIKKEIEKNLLRKSYENVIKKKDYEIYQKEIEEKCFRSMENLLSMKDYILNLKGVCLPLDGPFYLTMHKKGFTVGHSMGWINFVFNKEKLKKISYEYWYSKCYKWDIKHFKGNLITEKTSDKFAKGLCSLIIKKKTKDENKVKDIEVCLSALLGKNPDVDIESLIYAIDKIPYALNKYYSSMVADSN